MLIESYRKEQDESGSAFKAIKWIARLWNPPCPLPQVFGNRLAMS